MDVMTAVRDNRQCINQINVADKCAMYLPSLFDLAFLSVFLLHLVCCQPLRLFNSPVVSSWCTFSIMPCHGMPCVVNTLTVFSMLFIVFRCFFCLTAFLFNSSYYYFYFFLPYIHRIVYIVFMVINYQCLLISIKCK